jgi:hypothetical protein
MYNRFTSMLAAVAAFVVLFSTLVSTSRAVDTQQIECLCIADTMFSGHSAEHNTNCGKQTWLRVKGFQGIAVFKFDMSKLEGSKVESATLKLHCVGITGQAKSPLTLLDLQISTIAHDWIEGDGEVYTPTDKASTYDYPGGDLGMEWAKKDQDAQERNGIQINVEDVINGFGGSILNSKIEEVTFEVGEWVEIPLDPELVQALVDGEQYGIVVWQPSWAINLDIAPREESDGQHTATLIVRASGAAIEPNGKLALTWGELKSPL